MRTGIPADRMGRATGCGSDVRIGKRRSPAGSSGVGRSAHNAAGSSASSRSDCDRGPAAARSTSTITLSANQLVRGERTRRRSAELFARWSGFGERWRGSTEKPDGTRVAHEVTIAGVDSWETSKSARRALEGRRDGRRRQRAPVTSGCYCGTGGGRSPWFSGRGLPTSRRSGFREQQGASRGQRTKRDWSMSMRAVASCAGPVPCRIEGRIRRGRRHVGTPAGKHAASTAARL